MYEAAILVITLATGPRVLTDTRGPYQTESACQARAVEIQTFIVKEFAKFGLVQVQARCKRTGEIGA